jgi:hypothetical protein
MRWALPPVWREIVFCNSLYPSERAHCISLPHLLLGVHPVSRAFIESGVILCLLVKGSRDLTCTYKILPMFKKYA